MNKALRLPFAAALLLFAIFKLHSQTCTGNLLSNPGFEAGLTGWTTTGNVSIISTAHTGTKAAHLGGNGYASVGQAFATTPGTDYTLKAWSKYTGSLGYRAVELRFLNASWMNISTNAIYAVGTSTYAECVLSGTAPAGTAYVYLLASKDGTGSIDVDDLCLTVGGTGGPVCAITPSVTNVVCNDNGTPNNPADDRFSFTVNVTNPVPGTGYQMVSPQLSQTYNGTYGSPLNIQNVPISTGSVYMNFTDNITANCTAATYVTAPPPCSGAGLPDLNGIVHEVIPGTNNCFTSPGQPYVYYSVQINNTGDVAATSFKVKFYFSTDNVLSANDVLWSMVNVPSLNIMSNGGPAFISPGQPVPASLAPGQYYVLVTIDEDNQVVESNEANNTLLPYPTQIGSPDVILDSYSGIPATVAAGSSFNIQVTLKYLANGFNLPASTSFPVEVFIPATGSNIALGSVNYTLGDFSQSNTVTKTVQVTVPASVPTGSQTIRMNASTSFCEPVYPNNFKDQPVTVTTGGGNQIDLELSMLQNTANPVIYSHYTTTLTLVNKGPQAATGVKVKWLKPSGVVYTGGNEFVASQGSFNPNGDQVWTVGSLPANGSATLKVSYFLLQNGAPVTYAQVIAADQPDVDSQPNNGTSPTPNQDDEAASGGSAPPVLTPDLTISNLEITNAPIQPGQILGYYFDLANIGNGNAPQDFIVRAWISTSPSFNTSGIQDGIVPTGNFIAGFNVTEVPGASTLPANLAPGQYYLHLWVDADQQVSELSENNNTISKGFLIVPSPQSGSCYELAGPGGLTCVEQSANGNLNISYGENGSYEMATLDANGQIVSTQPTNPPTVYPTYRVLSGNLEKLVGSTVVYSLPIPAAIGSGYDYILNFTELNGGYVLLGFKTAAHEMYAIRTDAAFNVQQTAMIGLFNGNGIPSVNTISPVAGGGFAFTATYYPGPMVNSFHVVNSNLEMVTSETIQYTYWYGATGLYRTGCGKFSLNSAFQNYQHRGSWFGQTIREGHFENGVFVKEHVYETSEQTSMGDGTRNYSWELYLADGSTIRAYNSQPIYHLGAPIDNIVYVVKKLGNTVIWEKYVEVSSAANIRRIALSGDELVFISQVNNVVFVETLNCLEPTNPKPDLMAWQGYVYPTTIPVGTDFTIGNMVLNTGIATAPNFIVKYYLSVDASPSPASDILISQQTFTSITPGNSGSQSQQLSLPLSTPSGNYFLLMVADPDNLVAEENETNNVYAVNVTVTGGGNPQPNCGSITLTAGMNSLSIANATAPHVLIKLFNPNWTLNFMCLDDCANPLMLNNLNAGVYHLQIKLLDNGWGEICYLEQDVTVNSFGAGSGTSLARSDDRLRLSLDRFYPSPASYQVTVDVFSPVEQAATLDFYDQMGRPVQTMKVQLDKGSNAVPVLVYDWKSGSYNVIARGEQMQLPAYGRFLKVWEE